uniref:Apple domain-containing protein n=1 Tax=Panagrolaimus sp. JU765 TaxID=591449 RepID=A0AC34QNN9_9BILA
MATTFLLFSIFGAVAAQVLTNHGNSTSAAPMVILQSPSNATKITIPPSSLFYSGCVISEVDPNSSPSSEVFDVRGPLDDCAAECKSETLFNCTAYTFGGPGSYCVLHGKIDKFKVTKKPGSTYSITDVKCLASNGNRSQFELCSFNQFTFARVSAANLNVPFKAMSAMSRDHCAVFCNMRPYASICTSFAFDSTVEAIGHNNCVLLSRNNATALVLDPGNSDFFENPCLVADYSK